ncbi:hypothetical protein Back2_11600 [Nocardioides baekrokdamisoli]|uniref:Uncharacterized protein n=1 Tax=Nocardioides baekrokdamisoli TaxID=1804624 RepID=A0A3G9IWX9_9ACTN|nr:MXAN_6640 family putative metalloprotease [Nocardioides baekrokdamisoli]BBH16873.1 hypothetical protein Back2_11600 [Nocardioides baekrokdamisoli]
MRRLGLLLTVSLLLGGLSAPVEAATKPVPHLPNVGGPVFINYGSHHLDSGARPKAPLARTSVPQGDVSFDTSQQCTVGLAVNVCVNYTTSGANAATSQFVSDMVAAYQHAEDVYTSSGYKAIEADPNSGNATPSINVFLVDLFTWQSGAYKGAYGFTAPAADSPTGGTDGPAYMVLDNDFSCDQHSQTGFPDSCNNPYTSTQVMQATVAHEFFHATQFAYDVDEDRWFMEATAAWAETQVYPAVKDNWQYLDASQCGVVGTPWLPLDDNSGGGSGCYNMSVYQDFLWFQYLTEKFPAKTGSMPSLILNAWRYSDNSHNAARYFSISAIKFALARVRASFPATWLAFSAGNRHPRSTYAQGAHYPASAAAWSRTVSPSNLSPTKLYGGVRHLASSTFVLMPQSLPTTERVHLAIRSTNQAVSVAGVTLYYKNGAIRTYPLTFSNGVAVKNVGFDSASLLRIELTLANTASTYTGCWQQQDGYSCRGTPTIDRVGLSWSASFYHL